MMEKIIEQVGGYGIGGLILAYFLYNDFQDRKAFREEMLTNREKIGDHETRITVLEKK